MTKHNFILDMDGILVDFVTGMIRSHELSIHHDEWNSWHYHKTLGLTLDEFYAPATVDGWWENLPLYDWAHDLYQSVKSVAADIIIATTPHSDDKCPSEKVRALRKHGFLDDKSVRYQIGSPKCLMAKSGYILIDDSQDNYDNFTSKGGRAILFPQPWNNNAHLIGDRMRYFTEQLRSL